MRFGTLTAADTLQALRIARGTVASYGLDATWEIIDATLRAHNALVGEQLSMFCEPTTQRLRRTGGTDNMTMEELDEFGVPQPQKIGVGADIGFPVRRFGRALQWTDDYFRRTTTEEFAKQVQAILLADVRNVQRRLQTALYRPTNYTFLDRLVDGASLPVKALQNNDTAFPIPPGPGGEVFATSHNHYLADASFDETSATALVVTVKEHVGDGQAYVAISTANEAAWKGLDGFSPYIDARIIAASDTERASGGLNVININNRAIGLYEGAEVWVKPWAIANYAVAWVTGQQKPLVVRVLGTGAEGAGGTASLLLGSVSSGPGDLELVADYAAFPMYAKWYRREFDMAVQNRVGAAVLYTGGASYAAPTLA